MASITAWEKKVWKDRKTEYPTRRTLTKTDGSQEIVTVARNEGSVSQEGDAFSAENMNDLEERIDAGFTEVNGKLIKHINITVNCPASTWCNIALPDDILSVDNIISVNRPNESDSNVYGILWWASADKQITILRINTEGQNLLIENTAKTIKLRICFY